MSYANLLLNILYHIVIEMNIRESCLQTGTFIYKPGISVTKQDFHLQTGIIGLQMGFSGYYLPKLRGKELADGIQKLENYLRERIYDTDGCICIRQLAEETGYSECYIRRVFQQVHGISPKNFERFVRFQKLLHVINKMPERIRLDALAQQCGYYDEAHMIKDFKQYAGITPQGYERLITGTKIPELEL